MGPRFIGPFRINAWVCKVVYQLDLLDEFRKIHSTFHVSQLQKCVADGSMVVSLDDIHIDEGLNYMEKPLCFWTEIRKPSGTRK